MKGNKFKFEITDEKKLILKNTIKLLFIFIVLLASYFYMFLVNPTKKTFQKEEYNLSVKKIEMINENLKMLELNKKASVLGINRFHKKYTDIIDYRSIILPVDTLFIKGKTQKVKLKKGVRLIVIVSKNNKSHYLYKKKIILQNPRSLNVKN